MRKNRKNKIEVINNEYLNVVVIIIGINGYSF